MWLVFIVSSIRRADPYKEARSFLRSLEEEEEEFIQRALVTKPILPATAYSTAEIFQSFRLVEVS